MKRIVWAAVAMLVMVIILGIGLHTLNEIDRKNKEYREKEAGQAFASQIAIVTETTSIWDRLRATTASSADAESSGEPQEAPQVPVEAQQPENGEESTGQEVISPEVSEVSPEQTTTVTNGLTVDLND